MKKILLIVGCIFLSTSFSFGQADDNYSSTLKTMSKVAGMENTYKIVIAQMMTIMKQKYTNVEDDIWQDIEKGFMKASMNDLVDMLTPVYKKYLTQEDLEAIIAFYQTPVGKKFAESTPLITQESMQVGQEWGMKIGQKIIEKMKEKGY